MMKLPKEAEILLYNSPDGAVKIDVMYQEDTIWLTQKKMAALFGVEINTINYHLKEIFKSNELLEDSVIRKIRITAADGKEYPTQFYSLDAIIAVGYRVNSKQATQFRIWATQVLKEFIIKGFVLDSERLKNGTHFGKDYFNELLEKIRDIRASERRFYQKITDIFVSCSIDYDPHAETTKTFYATVQNKLHWAIHGSTAPEVIAKRADHTKPHMGLTSWKQAPKGNVLRTDVGIAKNYLSEEELAELNQIVAMYLDFAELQAKKRTLMKMQDWKEKLDAFLRFNDYTVLDNPGKVKTEVAQSLAEQEFEKFRVVQDMAYISDFDQLVESTSKLKDWDKK